MQPYPAKSSGPEGFRKSHPLLLVVGGDGANNLSQGQSHSQLGRTPKDGSTDSQSGNCVSSPTGVQFYSLQSQSYVHVLRFRSSVCMVRCSSQIVAVGLATQVYCFDALTLENKFSVLTYPMPQLANTVNAGYGPMAVGPRWLAYASNSPLMSNTGRLSPQNLTPSPGVSPSTSPGGNSLVARYAMESGKQLATGLMNLGDMGYKTLSKYCQEFLPDGSSSPVSPNSAWKVGRLAGPDGDNAGMVIVKDFVTREVISQFKAHTSPISALCFDPSGTLLVTASVYGNNINVFRIMPTYTRRGSGTLRYNCSSSHVHLYKLHRGITSAMIKDICFSHYSQWIAIVSSNETCHVFVLSPFGGDAGFQSLSSHTEEPSLFPLLSRPWWSASPGFINQQSFPPPHPISLSVVSRIKYSSFNWLYPIGNAAASAAGKVFVPSGAVAAVFHNSTSQTPQSINMRANQPLEHLLVYTPSGHVVQHQLVPSFGIDSNSFGTTINSSSAAQIQDDDLKLRVEPVKWWDVCRRTEWPEKEECNFHITSDKLDTAEVSESILDPDVTDGGVKEAVETDFIKAHEKPHLYLSNAEVQVSSGMLRIWQKSKMCFFTLDSPNVYSGDGGESEIEKLAANEVEIKRKELLPVFDHFHSIKSGWSDRKFTEEKYSSLAPHQSEDNNIQETVMCHSKPASLSSTESSEAGSSRRTENVLDLDQLSNEKSYVPNYPSLNMLYLDKQETMVQPSKLDSIPVSGNNLPSSNGIIPDGQILHPVQGSANFKLCLEDGYYKAIQDNDDDGCQDNNVTEAANNDDGENYDMLGGMFEFSEEG
ncbi:autophagy-related protein 18g [Rutidosis leptorrhynchoides]|uniref:autophagy-related protein 18g n=1 Tax=Rutidosis leptorrhynchoides TaxID=125765 RepID=UPI003A999CB3